MISFFKDETGNSKNKSEKEVISTILKTADGFVFTAKTSTSLTVFVIMFSFIVLPNSAVTVCGSFLTSKMKFEINLNKYRKYRKQYGIERETIDSLKNFFWNC